MGTCPCKNPEIVREINVEESTLLATVTVEEAAIIVEEEPQDVLLHPIRKPTGLFTVELIFSDADGSMLICNMECNELGLAFDCTMPMTVSRVREQSPSEANGVKCGMVLTSIAGQALNCQTVNEATIRLNECILDLPPVLFSQESMAALEQPLVKPPRKKSSAEFLLLGDEVCLTGPWSKWATDFPNATLEPMPTIAEKGTALMKLCVKLSSQSFSFQVITDERKWKWHLFPRDAVPIRIGFICSHVSKEGLLKAGKEDLAVVGLGNDKVGHGINFHVMEKVGTVVTIWVEVPSTLSTAGDALKLRSDTVEGTRIWYTLEDTGVQLVAGDGINLSRYKSYLPADLNLD